MALKSYKYACDNKELDRLLNFALSIIISDDLNYFEMPGMVLLLDILFRDREAGHQAGVEIDFLPRGSGLPVDFVVVSYRDCEPGDEDAGLYSYEEFSQALCAELMKQSDGDPVRREKANKIIQKFKL